MKNRKVVQCHVPYSSCPKFNDENLCFCLAIHCHMSVAKIKCSLTVYNVYYYYCYYYCYLLHLGLQLDYSVGSLR
jgi:hypothetical protein